ncbi:MULTISPECIES: aminopeptidase N [unclassified Synechococcus]|uniref:aminopeptidase N n=1 Tax=unclassified Synechococcus TaxID=2626047 RepID=UPI0008FF32B2|nr:MULTISPECIES: aminopeptidase N [unclassified Synechococcus]APD47349.1 aminopeptidase N [Synechococcus sp. SynAce01]MCT0246096.1 aminopeptidase N [Synechococcus sp. CS-601]TWB96684.1 alanyl aminopeptidase [Synechococcus sp. Ace-Pa]
MSLAPHCVTRLADYQPFPYRLDRTDLTVRLFSDQALVEAALAFAPAIQAPSPSPPLELRGVDLELLELAIDGETLPPAAYQRQDDRLVILAPPPGPFLLTSLVRIRPQTNTTLEGLYASGGLFTTQCEAEGFRRISFHPDRPDLLSRFRVRLEADRSDCPVLLSNGNGVEQGELEGNRHYAIWDDPFPKPSYLFALVAGRLEEVRETFTTASGRSVQLRLHVEPGDAPFTAHAMASLQRAMAWDERVYGLEYDLDEFNIVAVRHFNMGAMENKSLNIFNSKLVLADAVTATDGELERIESVIAHEYFHNWTGNRITCRDWFQLSLKEGLTVFRDQSFTADLHSAAVKRIEDVSMLRNTQFREDAGPTAHPVQPDQYQAIDNFYTTTIYEKGSELIRMLHTLLGHRLFMAGMALYVQRHDGTAATCEDFVAAMEEAATAGAENGESQSVRFDFQRFRRWYHQAGTPVLRIERRWDGAGGVLELKVRQHTLPTPGQPQKQPLVIPLALGLLGAGGEELPLGAQGLLVIDQAEQIFRFADLPSSSEPPALSLLRGFSAPVRLEIERQRPELLLLFSADSDPFARWDAGQTLLRQAVLSRADGEADSALESGLIAAFERILNEDDLGDASRSCLMALPGMAELEQAMDTPDPPLLLAAQLALQRRFGEALAAPLGSALERCRQHWDQAWPAGNGERMLTATAWTWLAAAGDRGVMAAAAAAVDGPSMTLARAGLRALQPWEGLERSAAMAAFYARWQEKPVILDAWFALEASAPFGDGLERVRGLLAHPRFDAAAPNSIRAVLGGLAGNPPVFHAIGGEGYRFMADQIADLDRRNPITASRMAKIFSRWQSYGPLRGERMREAAARLSAAELSANTREVVDQCLGSEGRQS